MFFLLKIGLGCDEEFIRPRRIQEIDYFNLHNSVSSNARRNDGNVNSHKSEEDLQRYVVVMLAFLHFLFQQIMFNVFF